MNIQLDIPPEIHKAMQMGAALVISVSGGKDSQAQQKALVKAYRDNGWTGKIFAVHSDLGRMEWHQSMRMCESLAKEDGIPLEIVRRDHDLLEGMQRRMDKLSGQNKPHWPSSTARYCTSSWKRDIIDQLLRRYDLVISAEGIRSQESPARKKRPALEMRSRITGAKYKGMPIMDALNSWEPDTGRLAITWYPIKEWLIEDVWQACGTSTEEIDERRELYRLGFRDEAFDGLKVHPAYVIGNDRVSCNLCIFASKKDLANGTIHHPEVANEIARMEEESGFAYRQKMWISDLVAEVLPCEM